MELWDKAFLDLVEPAYILFGDGGGEFAFGCVTAVFPYASKHDDVSFDWNGSDEGDQVCGDRWAELRDDGSLIGEIKFRNGDESGFTARRWETSSTAC